MLRPRHLQFRLRTLCAAVALVAAALGCGIRLHTWQQNAALDRDLRRIDERLRAGQAGFCDLPSSHVQFESYFDYCDDALTQEFDQP